MQNKEQAQTGSSGSTKVVVIAFTPDGKAFINQVETDREVPEHVGEKLGRLISRVTFDSVPKRLSFFLEKWGKPEKDISVRKQARVSTEE